MARRKARFTPRRRKAPVPRKKLIPPVSQSNVPVSNVSNVAPGNKRKGGQGGRPRKNKKVRFDVHDEVATQPPIQKKRIAIKKIDDFDSLWNLNIQWYINPDNKKDPAKEWVLPPKKRMQIDTVIMSEYLEKMKIKDNDGEVLYDMLFFMYGYIKGVMKETLEYHKHRVNKQPALGKIEDPVVEGEDLIVTPEDPIDENPINENDVKKGIERFNKIYTLPVPPRQMIFRAEKERLKKAKSAPGPEEVHRRITVQEETILEKIKKKDAAEALEIPATRDVPITACKPMIMRSPEEIVWSYKGTIQENPVKSTQSYSRKFHIKSTHSRNLPVSELQSRKLAVINALLNLRNNNEKKIEPEDLIFSKESSCPKTPVKSYHSYPRNFAPVYKNVYSLDSLFNDESNESFESFDSSEEFSDESSLPSSQDSSVSGLEDMMSSWPQLFNDVLMSIRSQINEMAPVNSTQNISVESTDSSPKNSASDFQAVMINPYDSLFSKENHSTEKIPVKSSTPLSRDSFISTFRGIKRSPHLTSDLLFSKGCHSTQQTPVESTHKIPVTSTHNILAKPTASRNSTVSAFQGRMISPRNLLIDKKSHFTQQTSVKSTRIGNYSPKKTLINTPKTPSQSTVKKPAKSTVKTCAMSHLSSPRVSLSAYEGRQVSPTDSLMVDSNHSNEKSSIQSAFDALFKYNPKSSVKSSQRSPFKSSQRSPVKSSQRSLVKSFQRSLVKSSQRSLVKSSQRSPVKSSQRSPVKSSPRTPVKSSPRTPVIDLSSYARPSTEPAEDDDLILFPFDNKHLNYNLITALSQMSSIPSTSSPIYAKSEIKNSLDNINMSPPAPQTSSLLELESSKNVIQPSSMPIPEIMNLQDNINMCPAAPQIPSLLELESSKNPIQLSSMPIPEIMNLQDNINMPPAAPQLQLESSENVTQPSSMPIVRGLSNEVKLLNPANISEQSIQDRVDKFLKHSGF